MKILLLLFMTMLLWMFFYDGVVVDVFFYDDVVADVDFVYDDFILDTFVV